VCLCGESYLRLHYHRDTEIAQRITEWSKFTRLVFAARFAFNVERSDCRPALVVAGQDLNTSFSFVQSLLTRARKLYALLEKLEALFQRQIATLKLAHNSLEFFQRRFKVLRVIVAHIFVAQTSVCV